MALLVGGRTPPGQHGTATPMLARLDQPPVPSVAHAEEVTTDAWTGKPKHDNPLNEVCEAYTGNAVGHRSGRTALKLLASIAMIMRKATVSLYR